MSKRKNIDGLFLIFIIVFVISASLFFSGCGGGQSGSPTPADYAPNRGQLSLNISFAGTSAHGHYLAARKASLGADSVAVTIEITGTYSVSGQPFDPITSTIIIDPASGVGTGRLEKVPIGVNHIAAASINFPGGESAKVKGLIRAVEEAKTSHATANALTTPATEAMIATAASSGKGLHQLDYSTYEAYVNYAHELEAAGFPATGITVDQILNFASNSGVPNTLVVAPATGLTIVGGSIQFAAVAKDANGQIAQAAIFWETDGLVGEIDDNGLFLATALGSGSVTATAGLGASAVTAAATVIVSAPCSLDSDCDDGDAASIDSCLNPGTPEAVCSNITELCGNGIVEGGEACDDGEGNGMPNMCDSTCGGAMAAVCGNGTVEAGESCDDGNAATEACSYGDESCPVCDASCQSVAGETTFCGDGSIDEANGEVCDDGTNNGMPNMCNVTCDAGAVPICGNGVVESGEACDSGQSNGLPNMCDSACGAITTPICGNGIVEAGETCDDENATTEACAYGMTSCTVCDAACNDAAGETSICGDGAVDQAYGETCDDGANNGSPNMCNSTCNGTTSATCGNGTVENSETCDDGNLITEVCPYGDTSCTVCAQSCQSMSGATSYCGDAILDEAEGETCDDGANNGSPNMCNVTCDAATVPVCGNSVAEAGENCDDGAESASCNADCTTASCGDGAINATAGETCDDGAGNGQPNMCNSSCSGTTSASCGNGTIEAGEDCDDGAETASCNADCTTAACGDGAINATAGETCDNGANNGQPNMCNSTCDGTTTPLCGNSAVETGEDCDDGSESASCNADCTAASCGDGAVNATAGETCDDGASNGQPNMCGAACDGLTPPVCGNGSVEPGEECDDGGVANGDGCSKDCFSEIDPSMEFVCAMNKDYDGGVECWGRNLVGEIGDGSTATRLSPTPVAGLTSGVKQVRVGYYQACALTEAGGVKCWGWNNSGQLGNGDTTNQLTPVDVVGLTSGVKQISLGGQHSCALTVSGGVKCWGSNVYGQLGDGSATNRLTPVDVTGLTSGVAYVAAAGNSACAVTTAGGAKCWGKGNFGALGEGTWNSYSTPVDVLGLASGVSLISSGSVDGEHACALLASGGVKCWGANSAGQLGNGTTADSNVPVDVSGLTSNVASIGAGHQHTCAIASGGVPKCWGNNLYGTLGDGTTAFSSTPVNASVPTGTVAVIKASRATTCYRLTSGPIYCWGDNTYGQFGNGATTSSITPVLVPICGNGSVEGTETCDDGAGNGASIGSCNTTCNGTVYHICGNGAIEPGEQCDDGNVMGGDGCSQYCFFELRGQRFQSCIVNYNYTDGVECWGYNAEGELGDGTTTTRYTAAPVSGLSSGVKQLSSGDYYSCAVTTTGGVKCWGKNVYGNIGNGTGSNALSPVDVVGLTSGAKMVSAGQNATCAVMDSGNVKCWGNNSNGELGNGTNTGSASPVDVSGIANAVSVQMGANYGCALLVTGGVKCWGYNGGYYLGDGTMTNSNIPVQVSGLTSGVAAIYTNGGAVTCALMASGGAKCWGGNGAGNLGTGDTIAYTTPQDVLGLTSGVIGMGVGYDAPCALLSSGGVQCWGGNAYGQVGDGTLVSKTSPTNVTGLTSGLTTAPACGIRVCSIRKPDGSLWYWGSNMYGTFGDGTTTDKIVPTQTTP